MIGGTVALIFCGILINAVYIYFGLMTPAQIIFFLFIIATSIYECLNKRMKNLTKHRLFATLKIQFNQAFGKYKLTDIRRLDLMLWALRTT